jgi:NAD(P)H-hydrate repair Nnr-like enzyme with NAD(P)H-hydrate dehydratase domain
VLKGMSSSPYAVDMSCFFAHTFIALRVAALIGRLIHAAAGRIYQHKRSHVIAMRVYPLWCHPTG